MLLVFYPIKSKKMSWVWIYTSQFFPNNNSLSPLTIIKTASVNTDAEVFWHPISEKYLYISNRGHDSIVQINWLWYNLWHVSYFKDCTFLKLKKKCNYIWQTSFVMNYMKERKKILVHGLYIEYYLIKDGLVINWKNID